MAPLGMPFKFLVKSNRKWVCGRGGTSGECKSGPDKSGHCRTVVGCEPVNRDGEFVCGRTGPNEAPCKSGPGKDGSCGARTAACRPVLSVRALQQGAGRWVAMITLGLVAVSISVAGGSNLLTPGPMTTAHGTVEKCSSCHAGVKPGPVGWMHSVFAAANPREDSMACLTCHKIGPTAINPHSTDVDVLEKATNRIESKKLKNAQLLDLLREAVFPVSRTFNDGVYCQTCHKEHNGEQFDLSSMPDNRCQACHTAKVHNFEQQHPEFDSYPFKRRTRIFFDHSSHFAKHFPEELKKNASSASVPKDCTGCHTASADERNMVVQPFKQVCSACHLGQIVGADRPEGPKGITLITLPGLDIETLEEKGIDIGEWPAESEAEMTPFMKLLIGRDGKRKEMLKVLEEVDLLDLTEEEDETIAAVRELAWEIKDLFHTYTQSKPSVILDRLQATAGVKIERDVLVKLVAAMPRDVLISAQRHWLPNLASDLEANADARESDDEDDREGEVEGDGEGDGGGDDETSAEKENEDEETLEDEEQSAEKKDEDEDLKEPEEEPILDVDTETWTEFGGWYRQDYAILYKPAGHADAFMKAWLNFSARLFSDAEDNPAAETFNLLTDKNAQGRCSKCHSVDAVDGGRRRVNWRPFDSPPAKGLFTKFAHAPHLSVVGKDGCLTCHKINPEAKNQETYKQTDPLAFDSNFHSIDKKTCTTCHTQQASRDDCLLCHIYHVNPVSSPVPVTALPTN